VVVDVDVVAVAVAAVAVVILRVQQGRKKQVYQQL